MAEQKKLTKIKSSVLSRSFQLAKLTVNTGFQLTGLGLSQFAKDTDKKEALWKDFLRKRAKDFSQDLGELKGSLMKAGQMLSMYGEHFLPPEANTLLKSLQSQSPPLQWEAIEKVLKNNFSPEQLSQLDIEKESIGSASLGQVHRARIKSTGKQIVLKIQYPGIEKAIDSDLRALKSFLSLLKLLPKNLKTEHIFAEVREMLIQEMNYPQEVDQTEKYYARLHNDHRYVVPQIEQKYCSDQIIASSYEIGLAPSDPIVLGISQDRRNKLALNFVDLYFAELFDWGIVQTDPHLGNYRIRLDPEGKNDQLILLDFGAVRSYDDSFIIPYRQMIKAAALKDLTLLSKVSHELKFTQEDDPPELLKIFEKFCLSTIEPFDDLEYDWKNSDLPQRLTKQVLQMMQNFKLRTPPKEILFLDRKTGGVFIFCAVMKAKMNSRSLLMKHLVSNEITPYKKL